MTTSPKAIAPYLQAFADVAAVASGVVSGVLPEPTAIILKIVAAGLRFAASLAQHSLDPLEHIARVQNSYPPLHDAETAWAEALTKRFPTPPPAPKEPPK